MNLIKRAYKVFHNIVDQLTTTAASIVLSAVMFVFVLLSSDLGSLWGLVKQGIKKCIAKVKNFFKPKKTLAQEQQEYIEQQIAGVLESLQQMMERHTETIAMSGTIPTTSYIRDTNTRTGSIETPAETIHMSARTVVPAVRVINGDISIIYSDQGTVEFNEPKKQDKSASTHSELEGWWEE